MKTPARKAGGATLDAASNADTQSNMTGANSGGGKSASKDIFNMFRGGAIEDLKKEYGGTRSGLTQDNKAFNKLQKGYQAAPS